MPKGVGYSGGKMGGRMKGKRKKMGGGFKGNAMSRSNMAASKGKSTMKRTPMGKV